MDSFKRASNADRSTLRANVTSNESYGCCGASGHVIELAERVRECGYDPADKLFASCIDIDICAVFMSYLQLSVLGIPAVIQHGNTLTLEVWRTLKTPAFYTHNWNEKLAEKNTFQDSFPPLLSQMPLAI